MKIFLRLLLYGSLFCISQSLLAQKVTFDNVLKMQLRNSGSIVENQVVVGYYFFYYVDRKDSKNNNYLLRVVDENLEEVFQKKISKPKATALLDVVYNGKAFLMAYLDTKERAINLNTYDAAGEKLGGKTVELSKVAYTTYGQKIQSESGSNSNIYPVGEDGFVFYLTDKKSKWGYDIRYFPNDFNRDSDWKKGSKEKSELIEMAECIGTDDQYVFSNVMKRKKLLSNKDIQNYFQVIDHKTGEKLFEKLATSKGTTLFPINAFHLKEKGQFLVFGSYYPPDEDPIKGDSDGIMCMVYDKEGKIVQQEKYSWLRYFKKAMDKNKKGQVKGSGSIYLHKIVQTSDGHIYGIGEYYRKAVSAGGIASQALAAASGGSGASAAKMVVRNMVIMELNESLEMLNVEVIEKPKTNVALPQGFAYASPGLIAAFMKSFGWFDYSFTQVMQDNSTFTMAYQSVDRGEAKGKGEGKGKKEAFLNFVSRTVGDDAYVVDKLPLSTEASYLRYYPAKPGYIMITEYYKKAKKLDVHLEKVNF